MNKTSALLITILTIMILLPTKVISFCAQHSRTLLELNDPEESDYEMSQSDNDEPEEDNALIFHEADLDYVVLETLGSLINDHGILDISNTHINEKSDELICRIIRLTAHLNITGIDLSDNNIYDISQVSLISLIITYNLNIKYIDLSGNDHELIIRHLQLNQNQHISPNPLLPGHCLVNNH
jgi:hypothetical protein